MAYDHAGPPTGVTNAKGGTSLSAFSFGSLDGVGNPQILNSILGASTATTYYNYDPYDRDDRGVQPHA